MFRYIIITLLFVLYSNCAFTEIFISANSITRLPDHTIIASGKVKISNDSGKLLLGDNASINQKNGIISMFGHVIYLEKNIIFFARYIKTDRNLKHLIALNGGAKTSTGINVIARHLDIQKKKNIFQNAKYTRCNIKNGHTPLWCLSASTVGYNIPQHKYSFYNLFLRFYDVPVLYIPYLYHYDSSIKRKMGLLTPTQGDSKSTGLFFHIPYFIPIGLDKNLIIDPYITSKQGIVPHLSYAQAFNTGDVNLSGLYFSDKTKHNKQCIKKRWYINANSILDISDHLRNMISIKRASDQNLLLQYPMFIKESSKDYLLSNEKLEGFWEHSYLNISFLSLQNLQQNIFEHTLQIPSLSFDYTTRPIFYKGYFFLHNSIRSMIQKTNQTQIFGSLQQGYYNSYSVNNINSNFQIFMQEDFLNYNTHKPFPRNQIQHLTSRTRLYQRFGWILSYPLFGNKYIINPFVGYIGGLIGKNWDNTIFQYTALPTLDISSLFSLNRMSDNTLIDTSKRLFSGIKFTYQSDSAHGGSLLIARNKSSRNDNATHNFLGGVRESQNTYISSYINPTDWLSIDNNIVLNNKIRFAESDINIYTHRFFFKNQYVFYNKLISSVPYIHYLITTFGGKITPQVSFMISDDRNIDKKNHQPLKDSASILYENECLALKLSTSWSFIKNQYIKPQATYIITVQLKSIGSGGWHETNELS